VVVVPVALRVAAHQHHHILVLMVKQEHQVDQDPVVVKMVMIMDLLVLALVLLQAVILVQLMEPPLHPLVVEAVVLALLVMTEMEVIPGLVVPVEQVKNSLQHS
tara:strand:- start:408 stop:719 length:312 start_codon:yes stop_codon:yes gene_type:complete